MTHSTPRGRRASAAATSAAPVALVTGAAVRLGREIAVSLAHDGFDIVVHYGDSRRDAADTVAAIRQIGRRACAIRADLASVRSVESLLEQCARALGEVSCLVNSASLFEPDTVRDFDAERLARHMQVNVAAPVMLARQVHGHIRRGAQGVVINLLDQKLWNPNPDFLSYTLSKSALREATRLLAQALAPKLRVVGLAPGITLPAPGQRRSHFERVQRLTPLGYSSSPQDIAQAVVYLARARAVTGTMLLVDGGQHLIPSERDVMFLRSGV